MNQKRKQKDEIPSEILERLPKSLITFRKLRREYSDDGGESSG